MPKPQTHNADLKVHQFCGKAEDMAALILFN